MLRDYANQTLTLGVAGTPSKYNEIAHSTRLIRGRKEMIHKLIRTSKGEEVVSTAMVLTESTVAVNDEIDGRLVISSEPMVDLDGKTVGYEVYLA